VLAKALLQCLQQPVAPLTPSKGLKAKGLLEAAEDVVEGGMKKGLHVESCATAVLRSC